MRYSIVIPTYNRYNDCLRPCLRSVFDNTPGIGDNCEVIVVSNGCKDGTYHRVRSEFPQVRILRHPDPIGYTRATNWGIREARGEMIVLLNNDCQVLEFGADGAWLELLAAPFSDPSVAVSGPSKVVSPHTGLPFIIFFCAMVPSSVFGRLGLLDEQFSPGGGEDIDFAARAHRNGMRVVRVPDDGHDGSYVTPFPIYHRGGTTVHSQVDGWEDLFAERMSLLEERTALGRYTGVADVTCEVCTRGRSDSTLPLALMSVLQQTVLPKKLVVFDDQPSSFDMRSSALYRNLFALMDRKGVEWRVEWSDGVGQVCNHQRALDEADTQYVWRLDDDCSAEPHALERMLDRFAPGVAAVAPSVPDPTRTDFSRPWSVSLSDIDRLDNVQWHLPGTTESTVVEVEHLYSTFVYRRDLAPRYETSLSPVGHREETIFTHRMRSNGRLLVARDAVVWHLRHPSGGIRTEQRAEWFEQDEKIFRREVGLDAGAAWFNLDCGMGDHVAFLAAYPRINKVQMPVIYSAHPWLLEELEGSATVLPVSEHASHMSREQFDLMNVYSWCARNRWSGTLTDAFVQLYGDKKI